MHARVLSLSLVVLALAVAATAAPSITSVSPATFASAAAPIPVTITGTGFVAGSVVSISVDDGTFGNGVLAGPTTFVSATELHTSLNRMPAGDATLRFLVSNGPSVSETSNVVTAPFTASLTAATPVLFDRGANSVRALVAPSSKTYWLAAGDMAGGAWAASHVGLDGNGDGVDEWILTRTLMHMAKAGVIDSTGAFHVDVLPTFMQIADGAVQPPSFELGPNGQLSRLIVRGGTNTIWVLWVRPGVGAWDRIAVDGGPNDADKGVNFFATMLADQFHTLDGPAPPDRFAPDDVVFAFNTDSMGHWIQKLPVTLAPTPGSGSLRLSPSGATEGNPFHVRVNRDGGSDGTITLDYATADGTALAGQDYVATTGTLTFAAGEFVKELTIPTINDAVYAGTRTLTLVLTPHGAPVTTANPLTLQMTDDDLPPIASVADASVVEGDSGTQNVTMTATLSAASRVAGSVAWYDGINSGTISFPAGATSQTFTVPVEGNTTPEPDRVRNIVLLNPVNLRVGSPGHLTIIDNDTPKISILNNSTVTEPAAGFEIANFVVSLNVGAVAPVSVHYRTVDGTAVAGQDYEAVSGTLTFQPGQGDKSVPVRVLADNIAEPLETFDLLLESPTGATIVKARATMTIIDSNTTALSINDVTVTEPGAGFAVVNFPVALSAPAAFAISVHYRTIDGTALAGADYEAVSGTLTFQPGETAKSVAVHVLADGMAEPLETFDLLLEDATGGVAIVDARGTAAIVDTPPTVTPPGGPVLTIGDVRVAEGNDGIAHAVFTARLDAAQTSPFSVAWSTIDETAKAGSDYVAASGTLLFAPGETAKSFTVDVIGDISPEPDETFSIVVNAVRKAVCTIVNDDAQRRRASRH